MSFFGAVATRNEPQVLILITPLEDNSKHLNKSSSQECIFFVSTVNMHLYFDLQNYPEISKWTSEFGVTVLNFWYTFFIY